MDWFPLHTSASCKFPVLTTKPFLTLSQANELGHGSGEASKLSNTVYDSEGANAIMPLAITYILLMNIITLWAAMSLA